MALLKSSLYVLVCTVLLNSCVNEMSLFFQPLCYGKEICSIVRTSPGHRSSRCHQIPVNTKAFCIPKGVPEGNGILN